MMSEDERDWRIQWDKKNKEKEVNKECSEMRQRWKKEKKEEAEENGV